MIATSLIVAAVCVCLGLTARAVQHRLDRTHMRPVRYHHDTAWRAFGDAMSKTTKPSGGKK